MEIEKKLLHEFKIRIDELYTDPLKWNVRKSAFGALTTEFQTDKIHYTMRFVDVTDDEITKNYPEFNPSNPDIEIYEVLFGSKPLDQNKKISRFGVNGTGSAPQVLATVLEITKMFAEQHPGVILYFSAKEPSRQKLYSRLVKNLANQYDSYEANGKKHYLVYV